MKNLKLKAIFSTLMTITVVTLFLTSCEKQIAETGSNKNEITELISQTTGDEGQFMNQLIQSTSSEKIKQWLTMYKSKETNRETVLKLFSSFSIEETKEVNEIIAKLEYHVFEKYTVNKLKLSEADQSTAKREIAEALENRKIINEAAVNQFKKNMWSLNKVEFESLKINQTNELMSRESCSDRKRIFDNNSTMTPLSANFSNCKASYEVKACSGNLNNCASDCDWEFRFDGKKSNHRIVYNHLEVWDDYYTLAIVIDIGLWLFHGPNLGTRYQYWDDQWHTYLQIGYPDALGVYNGIIIGRWTLRTFLSMH